MPRTLPETKPVEDTVAKVNDELAVGSDVDFQRRWYKMERIVWILLTIFVVLDLIGVFGRGPFANAQAHASDASIDVRYERIERFSTPSEMTVEFSPAAIHNDAVQLWANNNLVKPLGNQRVIPQPLNSVLSGGGILYTFPVASSPAQIEFSLEPSVVGISELTLQVPGMAKVHTRIFVVP